MDIANTNYFDNINVKEYASDFNECEKNWGENDCTYNYNKFYYYIKGESSLIIDGDHYYPKPYELYLIPAGTKHTYYHNPHNRVLKYWSHFDINLSDTKRLIYNKSTLKCLVPLDEIKPIFDKLIKSFNSNDPLSKINEKAALLELLNCFLSKVNYKEMLYEDNDHKIKEIHDYIINNLPKDISLHELSRLVPLQPNYFITYFKKHLHCTPIQYINNMRLTKAAQMLSENKSLTISSVAQQVGYDDYRYFSRQFKKSYGITPSQYKAIKP